MSNDEVTLYLPVIIKALSACTLNHEQLKAICKIFNVQFVKKDTNYCTNGKICETTAILVSGILISQYFKTGKELKNTKDECPYIVANLYFHPLCPYLNHGSSFYSGNNCSVSIQAKENSIILTITLKELNNLCLLYPELNKLRAFIAEANDKISDNRILKLNVFKNDDEGLLLDFEATHPGKAKRIGFANIASYLNMNRNKPGSIL